MKKGGEGEWTTGHATNDKDGPGSLKIKIVRIKAKSSEEKPPQKTEEENQSTNRGGGSSSQKEGKLKPKDDFVVKQSDSLSNKRPKLQASVEPAPPKEGKKSNSVNKKEGKALACSKSKLADKTEPPKVQVQTVEIKESPLEKAKRLLAASREAEKNLENAATTPKTSAMLKRPPSRKRFPLPPSLSSTTAGSATPQTGSGARPNPSSNEDSNAKTGDAPSPNASSAHPLGTSPENKNGLPFEKPMHGKDVNQGEHSKRDGAEEGLDDEYEEGLVGRMDSSSQKSTEDGEIKPESGIQGDFDPEPERKRSKSDANLDCDNGEGKSRHRNRNQRRYKSSNNSSSVNDDSHFSRSSNPGNRKNDSMVFVGDLPPLSSNKELADVFTEYATLVKARVIDHQCYGFVTFNDRKTASEIVAMADNGHAFYAGNSKVRVSWAHGALPEWKVGTGGFLVSKEGDRIEINKSVTAKEKTLAAAQAAAAAAAQFLAKKGPPIKQADPPHDLRERHIVAYNDLL